MNTQANASGAAKPISPPIKFLTAKEAAALYGVSLSWLAKRRISGDGPRTRGEGVAASRLPLVLCRGNDGQEEERNDHAHPFRFRFAHA